MAEDFLQQLPTNEFPHLSEMVIEHAMRPGYDYADEFGWGLDAVLNALEGRFARG